MLRTLCRGGLARFLPPLGVALWGRPGFLRWRHLTECGPAQGCAASLPAQLRSDSGLYLQNALQAPGQVEQEYWLATAQYVPNTGSVKPPELAQLQFSLPEYATGCVVHTVAASFQARHALESPVLKG